MDCGSYFRFAFKVSPQRHSLVNVSQQVLEGVEHVTQHLRLALFVHRVQRQFQLTLLHALAGHLE